MYNFFKNSTILRFALIHTIAYILSLLGCFLTYMGYWRTIFVVQTVDFNILSHTMPLKLSSLLLQKSDEELKKTINSNYGLFRIVVTDCNVTIQDCPNEKILYYSSRSFEKKPETHILQNHPYDLLKDPPPIFTESKYPKLFLDKREKTGKNNLGNIIGRVYYIRGKQPTFQDEYIQFIKNPIRLGFRATNYFQTTILFLMLGFSIWLILEYQIKKSQREIKYEKQKYQFLKAQIELDRINTLNETFSYVIETEFSSTVSNNLQKLDGTIKAIIGIISRLKTDTNNIIHDIQKAPLLLETDNLNIFLDFMGLNEENVSILDPNLLNLLIEVYESFKVISQVVEELREVTDLEEGTMVIQEELQKLKDNLPPPITKRTHIEFELIEDPLRIKCNPWRFRSIIRNVLYNSSAALNKHSRKIKNLNFKPKVSVKCYSENNIAIIEIVDNGPGIPLDILPKLYESQERLNKSAGELRGNGSLIISAYLKFHNGKVKKVNNIDSGATVSFLFEISGE